MPEGGACTSSASSTSGAASPTPTRTASSRPSSFLFAPWQHETTTVDAAEVARLERELDRITRLLAALPPPTADARRHSAARGGALPRM